MGVKEHSLPYTSKKQLGLPLPPSKVSTGPEHPPQQMEKQMYCHYLLLMHPQYQGGMAISQITPSEGLFVMEVLHCCMGQDFQLMYLNQSYL